MHAKRFISYSCVFIGEPNVFFRPMVKKIQFWVGLLRPMKFTNLHARPMWFSQCIAYIVTNHVMILNFNICIYFNFWIFNNTKKLKLQKVAKSWPKYIFFKYLYLLLLIYFIIAVWGLHFFYRKHFIWSFYDEN